MNVEYMYIVWIIAIVLFSAIEAATVQLISIWFVLGSVAAFISSLFEAAWHVQIIIWLVVSVISLILTRPLAKKKLNAKVQPTNADRCIGEIATVIEEINNNAATGQVRVDGKVWSARNVNDETIEADTLVRVERIEGVKLIVSKK